MKRTLLLVTALAAASASAAFGAAVGAAGEAKSYGVAVTADDALAVADLLAAAALPADRTVKVAGRVAAVCRREGCWLTLADPAAKAGESLRVTFRDHAFVVPREIAGRQIVAHGALSVREVSVERQRHLAEDAGRSPAEIAAIQAPRVEATLVADGLIVVDGPR